MSRRNMRGFMSCYFCSYVLVVLLISIPASPTASQGVEAEKYFDNEDWSLIRSKNWKDLHETGTLCEDGKKQSPIDVNRSNVKMNQSIGSLMTRYSKSEAIMKNTGHAIMVNWINDGGSLIIDNKNYILEQCHWHTPSEHTYNGKRYPLEMHMVHTSSDGRIAVIGILYDFGPPDEFLSPKLMKALGHLVNNPEDEVPLGTVLPQLIEMGTPYFRYSGSLTTPPCTEGVVWSLVEEVKSVSKEQVHLLRAALHYEDNARPIQPINGRTIYLWYGYHTSS